MLVLVSGKNKGDKNDSTRKFIDKIKQYIDEKKLFSFGDHVIIGLSGGADSVCLLLVPKTIAANI